MTMTPGSTKKYDILIRENSEGTTQTFVIRDMAAYENTDSTYTVKDWDNLENKDVQPVEYTHDGTTVGISNDESSDDVLDRWLEAHEAEDDEPWFAELFYGLPLYLYIVALVLLVGMTLAYRKGKASGEVKGRFKSKVEEQKKMREVESQTLTSLSSQPSRGFEPVSLTASSKQGTGTTAPVPPVGTYAPPTVPPESGETWACPSCGCTVETKFVFCIKCGSKRDT